MDKLKDRIDKKFKTRAEFAEAIGVDPATLSRMLSNGNWKADRIKRAVEVLRIPAKDIPEYFFNCTVTENGTNERMA